MVKIYLKSLTCIKTSGGGFGADDVYAKITIDGNKQRIRIPRTDTVQMNKGDRYNIDTVYEFENDLKIEFWDEDSGPWNDDDFLGSYKFVSSQPGKGVVTIANPSESDEYDLSYEFLQPGITKVLRLQSIKCVLVTSSIDAQVIDAVAKLSSEVSSAFGKVVKELPNPKAKIIGEGLDAASKVITSIPEVAKAIDEASTFPDQLFITTNNQPEISQRAWPKVKEYEDIRSGQMARLENVIFPLSEPLDFSFWEYDFTGSDFLGSLAVEAETEPGTYVKEITSKTECSIYLVAYSVQKDGF